MKRLVVCADGTWNDEDRMCAPTNVAKLHRALRTLFVEGDPQIVYYHSGVGTKWNDRLRGGAFGFGINRNIRQCYEFLVEQYKPGDELYFFGFSRGAYTARSLAGLVRNSGIVKKREDVDKAFSLYRNRKEHSKPSSDEAKKFREQHSHPTQPEVAGATPCYEPEIKFIGVWDTVGSLGYPLPFFGFWKRVLPLIGINWWFHDTMLSKAVQHAYHALAIHERRSDFPPTLWKQDLDAAGHPKRADQVLEQVWFPGVHCDVGGGYGASGLSDASFRWMVEKASACGLTFREHAITPGPHLAPDPLGRQHESFTGLFLMLDVLRGRVTGHTRMFSHHKYSQERLAATALTRYRELPSATWPASPSNFRAELRRELAKQLGLLSHKPPANQQMVEEPPAIKTASP